MEDRPTIERVVKRKLCTGCGTCAAVCPQDAIEMAEHTRRGCYLPRFDKKRCVRCELCHRTCPGHGVDFESFNDELFENIPEDVVLGRYLACYSGHAGDRRIRRDCASGGLVSSLLIFALGEGLIDGALVTRMRADNPLRPEPFIARTKDEILSAAGSKHCPVAAGTALKEILRTEGRFAVVGLPCHIQGIRKAEQQVPALRERIRYRIAIPCSLNYSFHGTERVLRGLGIAPACVGTLRYRGRGRPGGVSIRLKDGTERTIPHVEYYHQFGPHSLRRCTLCSDMLGELSDLTCGDACVPRVMRANQAGNSFVVSRTVAAEELLEVAASNEAVELSELNLQELLASQGHALFKKRKLPARMRIFEWAGQSVPAYRQKLPAPTRTDYTDMLKFYLGRYALSGNRPVAGGLFRVICALRQRRSNGCPPAAQAAAQP